MLTGTFQRLLVLFKGFLLSFQKSFFCLSAWRSSIIPHPGALVNTFRHLFSIFFAEGVGVNPLSHRCAMPAPPRGELFETEVKFLVAFETLALRAMACALSVKAYGFASSPKGRAKSTAGNFALQPETVPPCQRPHLRGGWHGAAVTGGVQARTPSVIACGDATFPKGTALVVAGRFLIAPNTLVMSFTAWLSLRESWRGSA